MHFPTETIVNTPYELRATKKFTASSLQKSNACQRFPRTQYIALLDVH